MVVCNDAAAFIRLKPILYSELASFKLDRDFDQPHRYSFDIEFVLNRQGVDGIAGAMRLVFKDVTDVKLWSARMSIGGILVEIEDIKSYQWEGIAYRISCQEDNEFSFYCREFTATFLA